MLKNLSVRQKIYAGFGVILVLLVVVAVTGYNIISGSSDGFEQYRGWARNTNLTGRIQANMLMVRMNAKDFLKTGSTKDVTELTEYFDLAEGFLKDASAQIKNPERAAIIAKVDKELDGYKSDFDTVVKLMAERNSLVEQLNSNGPQIERNLTEVMQTAHRDRDLVAAYEAGESLRSLLLARVYVIKFLESNDQSAVDRVKKEITDLADHIATLESEVQNPTRRRLIKEAIALSADYKSAFLRVHDVIDERNDIVQNKLDRIGPEIAKLTEDVKLSYMADQDKLGPELQAANDNGQMMILLFSLLALGVGIVAAVLIARPIIRPVQELVTVAQAIAGGDLNQSLELDQNDEIGDLASTINEMVSSLRQAEVERKENEQKVQMVLDEVAETAKKLNAGNISARTDVTKTEGELKNVLTGFNDAISAVVEPLKVTGNYIARISQGDIPEKITTDYKGDFDVIKNDINTAIETIQNLVREINSLTTAAENGDLSVRGNSSSFSGDWKNVVDGINNMLQLIIAPIEEARGVLSDMAMGNLTKGMEGAYQGDYAIIKDAMNDTLAAFNDLLSQVNVSVEQVAAGASQVSDASQAVSQGATEQASSLEETTASMTEINSQSRQNAENAAQANQLSNSARNDAEKGNTQMQEMLSAMSEINNSSAQISKIIKVIDEIAFQTNLLALNAAVEAARAGVHGKGFAVVAEEVRNLAQRSAKAAKETTELIEGSVEKVENGTKIAEHTAKALHEIIGGITKVSDLVDEIASSSREQVQGIDQVTQALSQIDQVTQQATANAEESASASEELSSQALQLKQMLSKFRLKNSGSMNSMLAGAGIAKSKFAPEDHLLFDAAEKSGKKSGANGKHADVHINLDDDDFGSF
jgi:methyl-accepting chemotaxis protein